jgi:tRNA modification GTPase
MRPRAEQEGFSSANDTIVALATAPGVGAVGIVRLSGPNALVIGAQVAGRTLPPRRALHATFHDQGEPIDDGIVLAFPAPRSYTGEHVVELQGHGGPVVLGMLLDACLKLGARLARPGEFTERAFLNGKLDLAQAEAVADLIASGSAAAARGALRSLQGVFSEAVTAIDAEVLGLRVFVEAALDFPDEAIEFLAEGQLNDRLGVVAERIDALLSDTRQGVLLRDGLSIALVGAPNVGKSSLLNRLAGHERAIVSPIPGTTRDTVEVDLVLHGLVCRVIDTAGIRASDDPVEQEGMRRSRDQAVRADLVLVLEDASLPLDTAAVTETDPVLGDLSGLEPHRIIRVRNKIDLTTEAAGVLPAVERTADNPNASQTTIVSLSALTGAGVQTLTDTIRAKVGFESGVGTFSARQRHVEALRQAAATLENARSALRAGAAPELIAEELRATHLHLGSIVGTLSADDLLGEIFATFCIGK